MGAGTSSGTAEQHMKLFGGAVAFLAHGARCGMLDVFSDSDPVVNFDGTPTINRPMTFQEKLNVKATLLSWSDHKMKADEPEDEANRGQFDSGISWEELKKNQKKGACGAQLGPNELLGDAINYSFAAVSTFTSRKYELAGIFLTSLSFFNFR